MTEETGDTRACAIQALHGARQLLDERGWCQGTYEGENGELCIYGALNTYLSGEPDGPDTPEEATDPCLRMATGAICVVTHYDLPSVFNDTPGRTKEEVQAALEAAASALAEGEPLHD